MSFRDLDTYNKEVLHQYNWSQHMYLLNWEHGGYSIVGTQQCQATPHFDQITKTQIEY